MDVGGDVRRRTSSGRRRWLSQDRAASGSAKRDYRSRGHNQSAHQESNLPVFRAILAPLRRLVARVAMGFNDRPSGEPS